ncbi:MAG: cation transporting ATPase C-terminal domain-containing protein, partial [Candidatus Binatia bacterium]
GAVLLSLVLQAAVIYVAFLQQAFLTASLSAGDWLGCAVVTSSVLVAARVEQGGHTFDPPSAIGQKSAKKLTALGNIRCKYW